jgi:hypothetical protein
MVANIDDNLGRLFARLKELALDERTIVVFLTDNGPQQPRYNGVWRDRKGSVYEGGIHVPGRLRAGAKLARVAAHIDIAPTLLDACGIDRPKSVTFDGVSIVPELKGRESASDERLLYFQWHRGDVPVRYRACAVRGPRYKLVQAAGRADADAFTPDWALYDMHTDPSEKHNVIDGHRELAERMQAAYDRWFDDVGSTRGYPVPRIVAGTRHENPLTLTRQDWRGPRAGWSENAVGRWDVEFAAEAVYDVTLRMPAAPRDSTARLSIGNVERSQPLPAGSDRVVFRAVTIPAAKARVEATFERSGQAVGVHYVDLDCRDLANP